MVQDGAGLDLNVVPDVLVRKGTLARDVGNIVKNIPKVGQSMSSMAMHIMRTIVKIITKMIIRNGRK